MLKVIKRFLHRKQIEVLLLELKSLEARLSSMRDKLERSQEVAEMARRNITPGVAVSVDEVKKMNLCYRNEVDADKREIAGVEARIEVIREELDELGF